jgi:thiol-disulfide isomerase/thioredoxin
MKNAITLISALLIISSSYAQDAIPPAYLVQQDFPDSVGNLLLVDANGEHIKLSTIVKKHQGKRVVIDLWASWCGDCIAGMPKLYELRKNSDSGKVDFIFISVDKEDSKWKKGIERFNIEGEHYRIEIGWKNAFSNYIDLDWIPRYLVLDEKGRIILPKAIVADDKSLQKLLSE